MNGDTLNGVNRSFWEESLRQHYPIAIEPEVLYNNFQTLATNVMSWAYWQYFWGILNPVAPPVSTFKAMTNGKHLGMSVKIEFSKSGIYIPNGTWNNCELILHTSMSNTSKPYFKRPKYFCTTQPQFILW